MSFNDFIEEADYAVIEDAYKRAARIITPDFARTYSEHLASQAPDDEDLEEALIDAHTVVAALGLVPEVKDYLEAEAEKLTNQWLTEHRVAIKSLNDERQDVYRQIREMSSEPLDVDLARPKTWLQPTTVLDPSGAESNLPCFERHMLCDEEGLFPEHFNSWEDKVLLAELAREETVAWYRNPARASQDSLGVTYDEAGEAKILRPDFVFFARLDDGAIVADIVDPHSHHLADSLPKLKGLAKYAEENDGHYRRIDAVAEVDGCFKVLDLMDKATREAVLAADSAHSLYQSDAAVDYQIGL